MTPPTTRCGRCHRRPVFTQGLCGPCFAAANGVRWAVCAECVQEGLVTVEDSGDGQWHDECAAFALSVIDKPHAGCRLCRAAERSHESIVDYRDRTWCPHCFANALARLREARSGLARFRNKKKES